MPRPLQFWLMRCPLHLQWVLWVYSPGSAPKWYFLPVNTTSIYFGVGRGISLRAVTGKSSSLATGNRRGHRQLVGAACALCRNGARHVAEARLALVALCRRAWSPPSAPPPVAPMVARPVAHVLMARAGRRAVRSGAQTCPATGASWTRVCISRRAARYAQEAAGAVPTRLTGRPCASLLEEATHSFWMHLLMRRREGPFGLSFGAGPDMMLPVSKG